MTRVLSELLGAREPRFSQSVNELERLSGHRGVDIRLTTELGLAMKEKLHELRLDHTDTTGEELYLTLGARLQTDEQRFIEKLGLSLDAAAEIPGVLARALTSEIEQLGTYALKPPVARKLLKANLPKRTMKELGYRSAESMFKHETPATLFGAAWLVESPAWAKKLAASYSKLKSSDFEPRNIIIEHPSSARWLQFAESAVAVQKRYVLGIKEYGAVVIFPLPAVRPALSALTTAVLAVQALNEVRAAGTYLKLHQMQPNFGSRVSQVVLGEPLLTGREGSSLSWRGVHQYFGRLSAELRTTVLEPLVTADDLAWDSAEKVLARIEPSLSFWQGTAHLGHAYRGGTVSLNLTDALVSHANRLGFNNRILKHFRESLEAELMLRYLNHDKLEQMVLGNLHKKLAPVMVPVQ